MKVWLVMGTVPYESNYVVHICSSELLANFLCKWCEAIEMNRVFDLNKKYSWSAGVGVYFDVEEDEVIS